MAIALSGVNAFFHPCLAILTIFHSLAPLSPPGLARYVLTMLAAIWEMEDGKRKSLKISESREAVEFYFIAFKMSYIVVGKALA